MFFSGLVFKIKMIEITALYCLWLAFQCIISFTVSLSGNDTCSNGTIEICCANFEMVNGSCRECKIGFNSKQGEMCLACVTNWFGQKCSSVCHCLENQRCDNVDGCVNNSTGKTLLNGTTLCADDFTSRIMETSGTEKGTHMEIIIYCIVVACLLLFVYICFGLFQHRRNTTNPPVQQVTETDFPNNMIEEVNENIQLEETVYHNLDESKMSIGYK